MKLHRGPTWEGDMIAQDNATQEQHGLDPLDVCSLIFIVICLMCYFDFHRLE